MKKNLTQSGILSLYKRKGLQIEITKSWRKTMSMRFDRRGVLQVKAPKFTPQWSIDAFINKNQAWIEKHSKRIEKQQADKKWYLFGEELVHINEAPSSQPSPLEEKELATTVASLSSKGERIQEGGGGVIQGNIESFYKTQAKQYIPDRCRELADLYGFKYKGLRITSAMTRWGSCSSKKNLNFSYRLIMSPREAIDYVIIHELCHLRQMNHGPKFWREVADIMPDYKIYEKHLKDEGWRYRV